MGGGLMQLVAYGAQDIYLTGNPQITFFKVVYRRHTNFSMECIRQDGIGGSNRSWIISRNGDLILNVYLQPSTINTPNDNLSQNSTKWEGKYADLENILENVKYIIEIGGQTIDKFTEKYRRIHNSLFEFNPTNEDCIISSAKFVKNSIINIPFWFCRTPGCALPLIALQYHEVKISTENLTYMFHSDILTNLDLWCTYVYLDTDERRRFAQVSHEYLIEQIQYTTVPHNTNIELNFNHPVKELMWMFNVNKPWGVKPHVNNDWGTNDKFGLQLNGQDRFDPRHPNYFSDWQINKYHTGYGKILLEDNDYTYSFGSGGPESHDNPAHRVPVYRGDVYVYSFALKPEEHQPSGTCNFSRIDSATLQLNYSGKPYPIDKSDTITIFAKNYNILRIMSGMGGLAYSN